MLICHCQSISDRDIHAAIDWMRAADADTIVTPGKVYHALGKRPVCGCCMTLFLTTMRANSNLEVPVQLQGLRRQDREETGVEGRRQGHRIP